MENWTRIYTTRNLPEANIVKGMLEENNVPVMLVNKQDSSYLNFGDIELYVLRQFEDTARQLINQGLSN